MILYVGNLYFQTTESTLRELFSTYGQVTDVKIITDHYTRQSKNFGYVCMTCRGDGLKAIKDLHGAFLDNLPLVIREARQREERHGLGW